MSCHCPLNNSEADLERTEDEVEKKGVVPGEFIIANLKPMTWTVKRDRDEELDPAQERERAPKRRKEDTRAAKLQWVGNALTVISKTTIVVLCRGI